MCRSLYIYDFCYITLAKITEHWGAFYRDYIFSWLPLRIYADGLREVLFFSHDVMNSYSVALIWVLVIALVLVWVKNLVEKPEIQTEQ
ncbi:hypothetical protein [Lysinibacillus endophyticus]|uniref:hypothetical protein n=1 Tax=Ureibacillus endophyticus TaxID=1978490 RepID=UPI0020A1B837|nr:hypothetical protein [Lysinibacillus endophyticus]MCP1144821.1 hypothetical protein [Lysinibacillus endophyticus]